MPVRQFYLSKNSFGYYRVHFINRETGRMMTGKSTKTKDKIEAALIAQDWLLNGIPRSHSSSRNFMVEMGREKIPETRLRGGERAPQGKKVSLKEFVGSLSQDEINELTTLLDERNAGVGAEQNTQTHKPKTSGSSEKRRIPFVDYMIDFWDFEKSKYLAEEKAYGRTISERHAKEMRGLAVRYWKPYFGDGRFVDDIAKSELEEFFLHLRHERGLSGATVNHAMSCASKVFSYLSRKELVEKNPFDSLSRFSLDKTKRGIPTETEVAKLMNLRWKSDTAKAAFCLGAFAGLRAGEISGLRVCDLDDEADIVHVRHTWNEVDGLKSTKNTDTRAIPVDHETMLELVAIAKRNQNHSDLSYVFWSKSKPEQPFNPSWYQDGFYEALAEIGISEEQRKERVIVFHSLRHFCATLLRQRADLTTVQTILGHRTEEMTEHYASHWSESQAALMKAVMSENKKHILKFLVA